MAKDPTLNFRPDQNTANADKRKIAREVHTQGSHHADAPSERNQNAKPDKGNSS